MPVLNPEKQLYPAQNPTSTSPLVSRGQHIVILYVVILLYGKLKGSLPGKFAHLYDFLIRSFDCKVCRSFHNLSWYDFR